MKRLVLTLAILAGFALGGVAQENIWKPIDVSAVLLGAAPDGSLYYNCGYSGIGRSQDEGETLQIVLGYETGYDDYFNEYCFSVSPEGRIFVFEDNPFRAWFSDDNGGTWQHTSDIPLSAGDKAWNLYTLNNNIMVGSTEYGSVFWTTDGGTTWGVNSTSFEDNSITDILANENGDVYIGLYYYGNGLYHSTLSDMQNWEIVAFEGLGIRDMEFDPEGNVVCAGYGDGFSGFEQIPGFYALQANYISISDNGTVYTIIYNDDDYTEGLAYSLDHGEHFTEIGERMYGVRPLPNCCIPMKWLIKGFDNHLYYIGVDHNYKSVRNADCILENFPLENTAWVQFYRSMYEDSTYYQLGIKGDTLVNEMTYKKVIKCAHLGYPIEGECFGGIRDDADGKCYFMSFVHGMDLPWPLHSDCEMNTEYPLYDFSLSVCDVFQTVGGTPNVVVDTAEMELNGSTRKVLWFGNNCDNGNPYEWQWIEDIGSTHSLLYPIQWEPDNGPEYRLVEVWQDEELLYRNPIFDNNGSLAITPDTLWFDEMYQYEKTFIINNPTDQPVTITGINIEASIVRITYFNGSFVPVEEILPLTLQAHDGIELIVELDVVWPWAKRDEFVNVPVDIISTAGHDVITLMIGKEATSFGLVAYPPYIQLDYYNPERFGVVSSEWDQPIIITGIEEIGTNYLEIIPDSLLPVTLQNYGDFLSGSVKVRDGIHEFFETEIRISSTYGNAYIGVDNSLGFLAPFGNEWYYEIQNENGSVTYQYMYQAGDTIVQDEPAHILVKINTLYDKGIHDQVTHEYVYERDGKLYWWNKTLEEFTVLYDFGAEVGDEWEIKVGTENLVMHVDAVEYIEYEDVTYRVLHVSDPEDLFSGDIVCGIGHLTSFFPERLMDNGDGLRVEGLRCYWIEDELVFKPGDEDCDAIYDELHGIEEGGPSTPSTGSETAGTFEVYPNPTNGVLFVETVCTPSLPAETYRITNLMGQTLLTGQFTAETQQINVSSLPQGMYFITIAGETRKFVVR